MANPPPPSYTEATQRADWLRLVAPYVFPQYYASLCLVSRRFYRQFAPLLWSDPIAVARELHRNAENDLEWYCDFILDWLDATRPSVRGLVQSLDLRGFAAGSDDFFLDSNTRSITDTLGQLAVKFPRLRCILIDGHTEANPNALARNAVARDLELPLLLSISRCQAKIEASFFTSPYFRGLIYLDISDIPEIGTTKALLQTMRPEFLPKLHVLKIEGHGMSDSGAEFIFTSFKQQLWSLDLSRNSLTDEAFKAISLTFPSRTLRNFSGNNAARSAVEGSLQNPHNLDTGGEFLTVEESEWSGTFSHPDRYLVDAPGYTNPQNPTYANRLNGIVRIANDSANSTKKAIANVLEEHPQGLEVCLGKGGITHLRLNENKITASGIAQMLKSSPGHFEHFECDSMLFQRPADALPGFLPQGTKLTGILGAAHLFRPVFSSNLQVLRIHHSLVTQILTIETDHLSQRVPTMIRTWAAETYLFHRAEQTYPQCFSPDMNPRLRSLTLTRIPRYSTGPLIRKLIHFLKVTSVQERSVQNSQASSRHHPQTLSGLRHLALEFEHDPIQELQELDLSFDDGSGWLAPSTRQASAPQVRPPHEPVRQVTQSDPLPVDSSQFFRRTLHGKGISVWIGSCEPGPHKAVNEYALLARNPARQTNIQPASPCHVLAGAPSGTCIFGAAWDAMFKSPVMTKPRKEDLTRMVDVIAAIKRFRQQTRMAHQKAQREAGRRDIPLGAPHFFWTGEIEVSRKESTEYYGDSKFWR
ncbi:hypothetical protein QBC34DRAFT_399574 [Podospora aff. communis PSN243]|uniref:F-box domain-containing protein n=1 Tax=Podospora aff. communis PSN243 TaxID=3040156 RepID=A0AAV9GVR2_9PEZI|nr:hypothetical protein QBC34DRAFT_399574 [Podospora aff. communis PSN243]